MKVAEYLLLGICRCVAILFWLSMLLFSTFLWHEEGDLVGAPTMPLIVSFATQIVIAVIPFRYLVKRKGIYLFSLYIACCPIVYLAFRVIYPFDSIGSVVKLIKFMFLLFPASALPLALVMAKWRTVAAN